MSNEPDRRREIKLLRCDYQHVHFLLNRAQCSASLFASDIHEIRSRHRYMRETIAVEEDTLLFFDLHRFWSETFQVSTASGVDLALVARLDVFSDQTQRWLREKFFPQLSALNVSPHRIAFRIPSDTTMQTLQPGDLSAHNRLFQSYLARRGIMAVHVEDRSLGFLCDLEHFLRSRLLFSLEKGKAVER